MFTGLVAGRGEVVKVEDDPSGRRIWVRSDVLGSREIGNSVALDGVCLTVTERDGDTCAFDVAAETVARSTLGRKSEGDHLNLETPLRTGDELGGHIVQGHVDDVGVIEAVKDEGSSRRVRVRLRSGHTRYIVEKGSVTVDGVSLTVTSVEADWFEVALIPHTLSLTTLGDVTAGREVNVEIDVIAKYVERLTAEYR
jgi:riboflavin synthase